MSERPCAEYFGRPCEECTAYADLAEAVRLLRKIESQQKCRCPICQGISDARCLICGEPTVHASGCEMAAFLKRNEVVK